MKIIAQLGEANVLQDDTGLLYMSIGNQVVPFSTLYQALTRAPAGMCQTQSCALKNAFEAMALPLTEEPATSQGDSTPDKAHPFPAV